MVLAFAVVLLEVPYPLVHGRARDLLTIATVLVFAAAMVAHLAATRGKTVAAGFLAATVVVGFVAEAVGTHTGFPFGRYAYGRSLGVRWLGVPLVIPLAWTMMSWPALATARRLVTRPALVPLVAGWTLAAWDVFLDPQMVAAHHWRWTHPHPGVPGVQGIPLTNFAGWLAVSVLLMAALDRIVPRPGPVGQPIALYLWTYFSSVLAALAFFGRPGVALVGGIVMGLVALPVLRRLP
jgi:putative membrane protein